jgi:GTP-binding protein
MKGIAFKDRVVVQVFAGNGGDGCCSFRREKYVDMGGPDGGDGGKGGSVILKADKDVDSLVSLYYQPLQRAEHGDRGKGQQRSGEHGDDLIIPVPCGTEAWEIRAGHEEAAEAVAPAYRPDEPIDFEHEPEDSKTSVFSLPRTPVGEVLRDGDTLLVAQGGRGGRGNQHYATSSHQAPREFTKGTLGEIKKLILELKTVADVGLVGYPNAGKSTLLSRLSHAHPKIAAYPFTTLNPIIGTLTFDDFTSMRIADIPGLIKGAHVGVGLGHDFLRHIERSGFLMFVIDMSGQEGRQPADDFKNLRRELLLYREDLNYRPYLIVANKMDLPDAEPRLAEFRKKTGESPIPIAASTGQGINELKQLLYEWRRGLRTFGREDAGPHGS